MAKKKKNPYNATTWILIGILVLGGLLLFFNKSLPEISPEGVVVFSDSFEYPQSLIPSEWYIDMYIPDTWVIEPGSEYIDPDSVSWSEIVRIDDIDNNGKNEIVIDTRWSEEYPNPEWMTELRSIPAFADVSKVLVEARIYKEGFGGVDDTSYGHLFHYFCLVNSLTFEEYCLSVSNLKESGWIEIKDIINLDPNGFYYVKIQGSDGIKNRVSMLLAVEDIKITKLE